MGSQYCPSVLLDFTCQSTPHSDFPRGVCHSYSLLKPPNLLFPPHSQFIENLIFPSPNLSVCLLLYPHILCFLLLKWMNSLCSFSRPVHFLLPPKGFCPSSLNFFLSSASFLLVYKHAETWPAFFKKYEEKVYLPFTPYPTPATTPFFVCLLQQNTLNEVYIFTVIISSYLIPYWASSTLDIHIHYAMKIAFFRFTNDFHIIKSNDYSYSLFCHSWGRLTQWIRTSFSKFCIAFLLRF